MKTSSIIIGAIIGAILGLPISYYFQPEMVRAKIPLGEYMAKISEVIQDKDIGGNVILSVIIFAIAGGVIGFIAASVSQKNR